MYFNSFKDIAIENNTNANAIVVIAGELVSYGLKENEPYLNSLHYFLEMNKTIAFLLLKDFHFPTKILFLNQSELLQTELLLIHLHVLVLQN